MFRKTVQNALHKNDINFEYRGGEVKRIEAFSDAVFAFAVTLLIVSLEVPKNFEELMVTIRGFFVFGISFMLLMMIWYEQNMFFRRYGLDDKATIVLNLVLIFLVLFYVYPLKFLFTVLFQDMIYGKGHSPFVIYREDVKGLMTAFGLGFIFIYLILLGLYIHAYRKREQMQLTKVEEFDTKTNMYKNMLLCLIGISAAGFVYCSIGPAVSIFYTMRGRQRKRIISNLQEVSV